MIKTRVNRDILLVFAVACWAGALPCFAQVSERSGSSPATSTSSDLFPLSLSGVSIDMSLKAFLKTHLSVKRIAFLDDSDKVDENVPNQVLFDKIQGDPFFTDALYQFRNSKLIKIGAFSVVQADALIEKRKAFLAFLVRKYGAPSSYAVVEQNVKKERFSSPALVWQRSDTIIAAAFPSLAFPSSASGKGPDRGALELKIAVGPNLQPNTFFGMASLDKKQQEKILKPVRLQVMQLVTKTTR